MTRSEDLTTFVKEALGRGLPRPEIKSVLLQSGWSAREVSDALDSFADVPFAIPVPKPRRYTEARDAFVYGVLILTLALSAYHLGMLFFGLIEHTYPAAGESSTLRQATRWPIAMLVVSIPIFSYLSRLVSREIRMDPSRRSAKSRNQMIYLTLFVCAAVVIGVVAGLVYNFLGGELTIRFILKSLTTGAIAAGIFTYYLREMRYSQ